MKNESKRQGLARFTDLLAAFNVHSTNRLGEVYQSNVAFKDPINRANGIKELKAVFFDLQKQLTDIRFDLKEPALGELDAYVAWTMHYRFRGRKRSIPGVSRIRQNDAGYVIEQEDYWDASFGVYAEFPLLGFAIRTLRRLLKVKHPDKNGT
jgi:hypothetical protein